MFYTSVLSQIFSINLTWKISRFTTWFFDAGMEQEHWLREYVLNQYHQEIHWDTSDIEHRHNYFLFHCKTSSLCIKCTLLCNMKMLSTWKLWVLKMIRIILFVLKRWPVLLAFHTELYRFKKEKMLLLPYLSKIDIIINICIYSIFIMNLLAVFKCIIMKYYHSWSWLE